VWCLPSGPTVHRIRRLECIHERRDVPAFPCPLTIPLFSSSTVHQVVSFSPRSMVRFIQYPCTVAKDLSTGSCQNGRAIQHVRRLLQLNHTAMSTADKHAAASNNPKRGGCGRDVKRGDGWWWEVCERVVDECLRTRC
jgi:hypothetical protein